MCIISSFGPKNTAAFNSFPKALSKNSIRSLVKSRVFFIPVGIALLSSTLFLSSASGQTMSSDSDPIDPEYPGTAVQRMMAARDRARSLSVSDLSGDWEDVRRKVLWAGGLKDLPTAIPGQGYTGHSFNDFNHCDLTTMRIEEAHNENEGRVAGIAYRNPLGEGIKIASLTDLGPGGSWSTCMIGSQKEPPQDVAHLQFKSRIAFKLVWVPPTFTSFVLVDDSGALLAKGTPTGALPSKTERLRNYAVVQGSKYAKEAEKIAESSDQSL